jgi:hypothetical protein
MSEPTKLQSALDELLAAYFHQRGWPTSRSCMFLLTFPLIELEGGQNFRVPEQFQKAPDS